MAALSTETEASFKSPCAANGDKCVTCGGSWCQHHGITNLSVDQRWNMVTFHTVVVFFEAQKKPFLEQRGHTFSNYISCCVQKRLILFNSRNELQTYSMRSSSTCSSITAIHFGYNRSAVSLIWKSGKPTVCMMTVQLCFRYDKPTIQDFIHNQLEDIKEVCRNVVSFETVTVDIIGEVLAH